jgi:cation transport ATPase
MANLTCCSTRTRAKVTRAPGSATLRMEKIDIVAIEAARSDWRANSSVSDFCERQSPVRDNGVYMRNALMASVASLAALGMLAGCLVLAGSGFTTSNKRANWEVFVSGPPAYLMAAIMFALSAIAVLWILRQTTMRLWAYVASTAAYMFLAMLVTAFLKQWLF